MMIVNISLESSIAEVKSTKCTSPWNLSERCVIIFVEILPAFNHSDLAMQMKILYYRWLNQTSYVSLFSS